MIVKAPSRGVDFLLELENGYAEPAIIFRDFPKIHGNIIRDAVGVALKSHVAGVSECEKKFPFLSSSTVSVDNFFMTGQGQIFLFETKRQFGQVRKDLCVSAARALYDVAGQLEAQSLRDTRRRLRHPIRRVFFSYIDDESPCAPVTLNIGTKQATLNVTMQVFGRREMNQLIGSCFGQFINSFDDFLGRQVGQTTKGLRLRQERSVEGNPLYDGDVKRGDDTTIQFGTEDCRAATEVDVLMEQ